MPGQKQTSTYIVKAPDDDPASVQGKLEAHPRVQRFQSAIVGLHKFEEDEVWKNRGGTRFQISDPEEGFSYYYFGTTPQCHTQIIDVSDEFGSYEGMTFYASDDFRVDYESPTTRFNKEITNLRRELEEAKGNIEDLTVEKGTLEEEKTALEQELLDTKEELRSLKKDAKEMEKKIKSLERSLRLYEGGTMVTRTPPKVTPKKIQKKRKLPNMIEKSDIPRYTNRGWVYKAGGQFLDGHNRAPEGGMLVHPKNKALTIRIRV